jgi:hypothetical protein
LFGPDDAADRFGEEELFLGEDHLEADIEAQFAAQAEGAAAAAIAQSRPLDRARVPPYRVDLPPHPADSAEDAAWRVKERDVRQHPWCEPPQGTGRAQVALPDTRRTLLAGRAFALRPRAIPATRHGTGQRAPTAAEHNEAVALQQQQQEQQQQQNALARAAAQERRRQRALWVAGIRNGGPPARTEVTGGTQHTPPQPFLAQIDLAPPGLRSAEAAANR